MGTQPILPVSLPIKKIKGAAHQHYSEGDGVIWCEYTINSLKSDRQRVHIRIFH